MLLKYSTSINLHKPGRVVENVNFLDSKRIFKSSVLVPKHFIGDKHARK